MLRVDRLGRALQFVVLMRCAVLPAWANAQSSSTLDQDAVQVLEAYISALGGREALARVKTSEAVRERNQFGTVSRIYRIEDHATRRFYQKVDSPDGAQELGYDGSRMWQKRSAFRGYLGEEETQVKVFRNPEPDPREYRESGKSYKRLADTLVQARKYNVLETMQRQAVGGEVPVKLFFDAETHLLAWRIFGNAVTVTQRYEDYRSVDGVKVPFLLTTTQPQGTATVRVLSLKYNVPIQDSLFTFRDGAKAPDLPQSAAVKSSGLKPSSNGELSDSLRLATFEFVWRKIYDTYWDTTFAGIDWRAVHERYLPLVMATRESPAFHKLLERMTGELHQSHFRIIGPESVVNAETTPAEMAARPRAVPGIELALVEQAIVIAAVTPGSPAANAGLRAGFRLTSINGRTPEAIYSEWQKNNSAFELKRIARAQAAQQALRGRTGDSVTLDLIGDAGKRLHVRVPLANPRSRLGEQFQFESRRIANDIGYIRFNLFYADAVERMRVAVDSLRGTKAVILDLRGNPGGVGSMSREIASLFSRDSGSLGTAQFRYEKQRFAFAGHGANAYPGKLVILVDEHSGSTSEVFAAGMQEIGRAFVVGDTSAGAVLPSNADVLPTGGSFQHPISDFTSPKGHALEGRGVIPDLVVKPTIAALLAGRDLALESAVKVARR